MLLRVFVLAGLLALASSGCSGDTGGVPRSTPNAAQLDYEGEALRFAAAIEAEDFATMEAMMQSGFNPDLHFSRNDQAPLVAWPLFTERKASLRKMLELGADPNAIKFRDAGNPATGQSPTYFDNAMVRAVIKIDPEYLDILLEHGGDPNTRGVNGATLIERLLTWDRPFERTELLIAEGADINSKSGGRTLLANTLTIGAYQKALRLLELGADPMPPSIQPALLGPDGKPLPQPQMPTGGEPYFRYDAEGQLVYGPDLSIVEHICWNPPSNPASSDLQQKMQQVLKDRGVDCPPEPERFRLMREKAV